MYTPNRGAELYSKEALGNSVHVGTNYMLCRQSISTYICVLWPDVKEQLLNYTCILTNNIYDCTSCLDDSD